MALFLGKSFWHSPHCVIHAGELTEDIRTSLLTVIISRVGGFLHGMSATESKMIANLASYSPTRTPWG